MTQQSLADAARRSINTIRNIESGRHKPSAGTLHAVAQALGYVSYEEMAEAVGVITRDSRKPRSVIPVFDEVPAGDGDFDPQAFGPDEPPLFTLPAELLGINDPSAFGVRVKGDSMMPDYAPGDTVICSLRAPHRDGMEAVVRLSDGDCTLKRVEIVDDERVRLVPINPRHDVRTVLQVDIVRIARVIGRFQVKPIES